MTRWKDPRTTTRAVVILSWVLALAELLGCKLWWPGLIGVVDLTFITFLSLVLVLGYRFDDGSPSFAVQRAMKPIRHASVWVITATALSWSDVLWSAGALVMVALIQAFQHPGRQPIVIAVTAGVAFMGIAPTGDRAFDLLHRYEDAKHWAAPMLACTTTAFLLFAAWAQHLVVRSHGAGVCEQPTACRRPSSTEACSRRCRQNTARSRSTS